MILKVFWKSQKEDPFDNVLSFEAQERQRMKEAWSGNSEFCSLVLLLCCSDQFSTREGRRTHQDGWSCNSWSRGNAGWKCRVVAERFPKKFKSNWAHYFSEFRSGEPPNSRIRVGFGFRVSGFVDWNQLSLSVFGFRVSGFVAWNQLSLSVSGFGFRVSLIETHFCCRFRVSGFGFRSVLGKVSLQSRFRVSGFGFWVSGFDRSWGR